MVASTRMRTPRPLGIAVAANCLLLLGGAAPGADAAGGKQSPPFLGKLWSEYPLAPPVTTTTRQAPPAPPPERAHSPTSTTNDGGSIWSTEVAGVGAGVAVLALVAGLVLVRVRRRPRAVPSGPLEPTEDLVARAFEIATECDMLLASQREEGPSVSETADHDLPPSQAASASASSGYAEIGERVASVLNSAETAADQIRADAQAHAEELLRGARAEAERVRSVARAYESDTREAVDAYASEQRRAADEQIAKQLSDAEAQARATREAAEEMAQRIEEEAHRRGQTLREESRGVEDRLRKALTAMRRMTAQLEDLLEAPAVAEAEGDSLVDALKPYAQRGEEMRPLVEDR
jgi:hypothetical protein